MTMKLLLQSAVTVLLLSAGYATAAHAQTPGGIPNSKNRVEVVQDRREVVQDRRERSTDRVERRDDYRDLMKIESLLGRFDEAKARRDRRALSALDGDLRLYVAQELDEGRRELRRDRWEAYRSQNELSRDHRENDKNRVESASYRDRRDDRRDTRDDRRDARDDARDARQEAWALKQTREISAQLEGLYGKNGHRHLEQKRELMVKLGRLARGELRENEEERREDRRETHEDRREVREDRNPNGWRTP